MTSMNKLSIDDLEETFEMFKQRRMDIPPHSELELMQQLLDTLHENEFLRDTITIIDMQAMNVMQNDVPPYGAILKCGWVHEKCKEALNYPNKGTSLSTKT